MKRDPETIFVAARKLDFAARDLAARAVLVAAGIQTVDNLALSAEFNATQKALVDLAVALGLQERTAKGHA